MGSVPPNSSSNVTSEQHCQGLSLFLTQDKVTPRHLKGRWNIPEKADEPY
jgi:hypothetical protein